MRVLYGLLFSAAWVLLTNMENLKTADVDLMLVLLARYHTTRRSWNMSSTVWLMWHDGLTLAIKTTLHFISSADTVDIWTGPQVHKHASQCHAAYRNCDCNMFRSFLEHSALTTWPATRNEG